ncbi:aspartic peptidase domain-containing protein [Blyttiomyces helicus]|uniref:Aspartic peptidase domain-containing protein n=1 Tax=Blyttiomyces helicus TaxID=388810 RepID=A0A4P9WG19_9FUNG|nr:aspartic peptidase domain-containing protein [Blyttiomyces helicus]|eukprot:RKO90743.1 aspartic peptidase domain-containing protein [Blyttiomyces helicus]
MTYGHCVSQDGSCTAAGGPINLADSSVHSAAVTFSDQYGTGSVSGDIYFGPYTITGATTTKGYFSVTNNETGFTNQFQGILGLSFLGGNDGVTATVGQAPIVSLGLHSVGFYLSNFDDGDSGVFTTNGFDASHVSGPFNFEAIQSSSGLWQFDVSNGHIAIGNTMADLSAGGSVNNTVAGTGSTFISIPTRVATTIWGAIGATNSNAGASIPCSVPQTGPDVTFTFSKTAYSVPASMYVFDNGDGTCQPVIVGGAESNGDSVSIFGDIFLRTWIRLLVLTKPSCPSVHFKFYDIANNRIGFAKAQHP